MLAAGGFIDPSALIALLAILLGSCAVFWRLLRQWTTQRRWLAMSDWAEINRLVLHKAGQTPVPQALSVLGWENAKTLIAVGDDERVMVQVETPPPLKSAESRRARWNLLVRRVGSAWPVVGLRPKAHLHSILDYLPLANMQAMAHGERFVLYASQATGGRALAKSSARALLPPDVGILLAGTTLVLDFSTRPFDPLELQRIDTLARQLAAYLGNSGLGAQG